MGAVDYITKPISSPIVRARVRIHLALEEKNRRLSYLNALIEERIAERTAALDALHTKEEEIKSIVENLRDGVITIDTHGIVRSVNQAVEQILGYAADEVIGKNVAMLIPESHRATCDGYLDLHCRTDLASSSGMGREVEGLHKNGECIALELAISEYRVKGQCFFVGTLHDIRERKRFIAELTQSRADAEQANRAKANFLAAMSHEIRTPMNGVIGMIDVLHQSSLKGYQVEAVDLIRESAFSLLTIIDDILDFSKIEAGRLEIESIPMSVASVVEKVCGLLDHLAVRKGVELTLFTDPAIPAEVLGDTLRLRQVLINLTSNAIKFSSGQPQAGRVSVRALLTEHNPDRVMVALHVIDNGIGMDAETLSCLFSPFSQADVSTTRRFGGTGLGLIISRNLAELMGGEITVQSALGEGSTFTLRLSFVPLSDKPEGGAVEVAGLSCLVVGDPGGLAGDLATYLVHARAVVERVADLATAQEWVAACPAGLWILIIDAAGDEPSLDGLRVVTRTRRESHAVNARFVVIGRGPRRYPQRQDADRVTVDGNVLNRQTLLRAVAIAAGRAQEEKEETPYSSRMEVAFSPLSRADALRQGRLILVAEDNETNQKVILRQLTLIGYAADMVDHGRLALQSWRNGHYALLLTDLHMPEMDGYQLTAAIRAEEKEAQHIPIIALTANALRSEAAHCRAAQMDDYLSKPVQLADLKVMLEKWLPVVPSGPDLPDSPATRAMAGPVDVRLLEDLVGSDPAIVHEFLQDFRASAAKIAVRLQAACQTGEATVAGAEAHKLKSAARAVGALSLGALCAEMEEAGLANLPDALTVLLPRFETEMAAVNGYLDSLSVARISLGG
ncbi:MAG: PAS domain S-box protein [Magnetococcales bacterium]|nr:PAS domain S-box protein [Magnetococcales bacterium]